MDASTTLALVSLIMTIIAITLSYLSWNGSKRSYRVAFIALMLSEMLIGWSYFLDATASTMDEKLLWNDLEYAGYLGATVFFLMFAMLYTDNRYATRRNLFILFIPTFIFHGIVASNEYHHLFYTSTSVSDNPFHSFDAVYGPLFFVFAAYVLLSVTAGVLIFLRQYMRTPKAHKASVGLVMFSGMISLVAVILNYTFFEEVPGGLTIMIGFITASVPLFVGAFGFELFEMLPFANERVMDTMQDSVIILDDNDRVLFMNRAAEDLSENDLNKAYLSHITKLLPRFPTEAFGFTGTTTSRPVVMVGNGYYELDVSPIRDQTGATMGKLVLVRDITLRILAQEDARVTHERLDLLNSITRHDIRNQLVMLEGRFSLLKQRNTDPDLAKHIDAGIRSIKNIERQISFAKDYQELGMSKPAWQSLDGIFYTMGQLLDLKKVKVSLDTKEVEVLADPLLAKVFYNLLDNSMMHGEKVTNISLKAVENGTHLEIVYEDDGVGVPPENKDLIFDKSIGKNSGLGLFLSREILRIGGMDIVEDGVPDKGVRFRITIPKGSYRFLSE